MKEKVKTALLAILVMTSLVQTYLLAYSQPEFDPISQDEYVEAEWIGPQKSLINMMIPKEIVIHRGMNNEHTVLHPHFYFYDLIVRRMQERTFRDFREISYTTLDVQKMRDEEQGVEFLFAQPVPSDVLLEMMSIRSESFSSPDGVNRVWITAAADASEVDAYFFTKSAIYVATNHRSEERRVGKEGRCTGWGEHGGEEGARYA